MDSATRAMIETLDKRIAKLTQIRDLIIEEFGEPIAIEKNASPSQATVQSITAAIMSSRNNELSRKLHIHQWLTQNQGATRGQIIERTGLPSGTVGGVLSAERDLFENREGKWYAKEQANEVKN